MELNAIKKSKPSVFSGVQPSGLLTLGNYLGALKHWAELQKNHHALFCVVDLHALTSRPNPKQLASACLDALATYLACGLNPKESLIFLQSQVHHHAEMMWLLNSFIYFGTLGRMTQFKDKSARQPENINAGLFTYPCLMAADILLYQTDLVPVGEDQTQHIELTREVAQRVNQYFGCSLLTVPKQVTPTVGAKIMSLTQPTQKMSKTDPDASSRIELLDSPELIMKKLKSATTDSDHQIAFEPKSKPGVSNLLTILSSVTDQPIDQLTQELEGAGYAKLKQRVGEAVIEKLAPIQASYHALRKDPSFLNEVFKEGAQKASALAEKTLSSFKKLLGLI